MTITRVVLESRSFKLREEERLIEQAAQLRGEIAEISYASETQMERGKFRMDTSTMAVGGVRFVKHALRQLGIDLPQENPYPEAFSTMLHREVRRLPHLRDAKAIIERDGRLFVKPVALKRFTGFVAESVFDPRFQGASDAAPVWISTPVQFVAEARAYVAAGCIRDVRLAPGSPRDASLVNGLPRQLDLHAIAQRITAYVEQGLGAPAGFIADFGLLSNGETALVEINDGFSFGAYDGVSSEVMWDVTWYRWMELLTQAKAK